MPLLLEEVVLFHSGILHDHDVMRVLVQGTMD